MRVKTECFVFSIFFQIFLIGLYISIVLLNKASQKAIPVDVVQENTEWKTNKEQSRNTSTNYVHQTLHSNGVFRQLSQDVFVYSVYYDDRNGRHIRLVGIVQDDDYGGHGHFVCLFNGIEVNATFYKTPESHALQYAACLITCEIPSSVNKESLEDGLKLENDQRDIIAFPVKNIHHDIALHTPKKPRFAVCVPPLFGTVSAKDIQEFIEATKLLGADSFMFYDHALNQEVKQLFKSYAKSQDVTNVRVKPWEHNFTDSQLWYYGQTASLWDCMFTNMYSADWIAFNDIDEYIVPRNAHDWQDMLNEILVENIHEIAALEFPSYLFILKDKQHDTTTNMSKYLPFSSFIRSGFADYTRTKMMIVPKKVIEPQIHRLGKALDQNFKAVKVNETIAAVNHYRQKEEISLHMHRLRLKHKNTKLVEDNVMLKYWNEFKANIDKQTVK
ncbi:beta-1,4-galactosyltransferase galt-1-like [Mya arenaria]|uniref:beta-1,4-galactosyltransferase galt-1-like n=1 Tax=Mya arenaria TaxID=6604 RepID=UPI0022E4986C|nr:beta-1,4-galactosyltransferase galt-1-like [Mya arenaria]